MSVLDKLRGGDLRSIGRSNEIVADIEADSTIIEKVFPGLYDRDPVLKARCADVIEKSTRNRPELILNHKKEIISILRDEHNRKYAGI